MITMPRITVINRPERLALVLALCAVLGWASVRALAAWHFLGAQTMYTAMQDTGEVSGEKIEEAGSRLNKALRYFPEHPDYLDLAGRLQELQAEQPAVLGKARRELLENAAEYHRRALAVRPLWPYGWVKLLSAKDKLGQVDREFAHAMQRAAETGPWEPVVQLQIINAGLRHWDTLKSAERKLTRQVIRNALSAQPREVFSIVRSYGRPDLVCDESKLYTRIEQWCDRVLTPVQVSG